MLASAICRSVGIARRDEQADPHIPGIERWPDLPELEREHREAGPCRYTSACRGRWAARCHRRGRQGQAVHALCRVEGVWRARRERRARRRVGSRARGRRMPGIPGTARKTWRGARNPWQCQNWVAKARPEPENPGSANAGWQGPARSQESLAVPTSSGGDPPGTNNPWQSIFRKTCQRSSVL